MDTIYFVGDAVLDNFYWLDNQHQDLRKELIDHGHEVNNYAINDAKVGNILTGVIPDPIHSRSRTYKYQIDKDNKVRALDNIKRATNKTFVSIFDTIELKPKKGSMIIISMGGNNINEKRMHILKGVDGFINSILTEEFIRSYEEVIIKAKECCAKILLVGIYLPFMGRGSSYIKYINISTKVINAINNVIKTLARKYNIPFIDLNSTLNNTERLHYGTVETYLSNLSSKCLADIINYISKNYDGYHNYSASKCDFSKICIN